MPVWRKHKFTNYTTEGPWQKQFKMPKKADENGLRNTTARNEKQSIRSKAQKSLTNLIKRKRQQMQINSPGPHTSNNKN